MKILFSIFLFSVFLSVSCFSQDSLQSKKYVNFFLDCDACDFDFVRQELPFISFVRDAGLADVHILVSISHTGSGAHKYFMNFIGMNSFKGMDSEYTLTSDATFTEDDSRKGLLKLIKAGVLPYISKTDLFDNLDIGLTERGNNKARDLVVDRWNKWIFQISSGGQLQKEQSQNEFSVQTEARIEKITENWKTRLEASYNINRENYFDDGEKISNNQKEAMVQASYVKSLSSKWSAGLFSDYSSSTFLNTDNSLVVNAGIEYNIFPWEECNRRVFTVGYRLGVAGWDYHEVTIYDKINEIHAYEALAINLEFVQPWGTVETNIQGHHAFYDFSKYRFTFESDFSIRLTKQLSVYSEFQVNLIHDQLYLPKGNASVEDLLLRRRKLATTYEINGELGLRFTFGSIYSNVVNERF